MNSTVQVYLTMNSWFYDYIVTKFARPRARKKALGFRALLIQAQGGNTKMADPAWMSDPPQEHNFSEAPAYIPPGAYLAKAKTDRCAAAPARRERRSGGDIERIPRTHGTLTCLRPLVCTRSFAVKLAIKVLVIGMAVMMACNGAATHTPALRHNHCTPLIPEELRHNGGTAQCTARDDPRCFVVLS
jgi:hypothetical protein